MPTKSRGKKKSGARRVDKKHKGLVAEPKDRVAVLENLLKSNQEKITPNASGCGQPRDVLRVSEEAFRTLAGTSYAAIMMHQGENFVYVNNAAERITGYVKDELLAMPFWRIVHPDDREFVKERGLARLRGEVPPQNYEVKLLAKDGGAIWALLSAAGTRYGGRSAVIMTLIDITERKQAELALRASEEKFRVLAEMSPSAIILYQGDRPVYANPAALALTGFSMDELLSKNYWDMVHPEYREMVGRYGLALQRGEQVPSRFEVKYITKGGEGRWAEFTADRLQYRDMPAAIVTAYDITERKRADAELRRLNRAKRAISRCNEAMIHARDEHVLLQDICKIVVKEGGYRMAWIGYAMDDDNKSVPPMARAGYEEGYIEKTMITWANTERGRGPAGTAVRTKRPSVIRNVQEDPRFGPWRADAVRMSYASVLGLPLIADQRAFGVLTIYSDKPNAFDADEIFLLEEMANNLAFGITSLRSRSDREQAEIKLREAKQQAELYLDLMGHDINNLHQIALGYLELARDMPAGEEQAIFLDKPVEVLRRSAQLIQNVRKLQKLRDGVFRTQVVDVCRVISDVQRELGAVPDKLVVLNMNGRERCFVLANELLHDVFANLVSNAIKHTGGRAEIVIDLDVISDNGRRCCRVFVEDNGPGIPDEFKAKIFDRTLKGMNNAKGMGLGLYLVKSLVDSYGGRVWAEDRVLGDHTKGARFAVMLPAVEK